MNEPNFTWSPRSGAGAAQAMAEDEDETFRVDERMANALAADVLARLGEGLDQGRIWRAQNQEDEAVGTSFMLLLVAFLVLVTLCSIWAST